MKMKKMMVTILAVILTVVAMQSSLFTMQARAAETQVEWSSWSTSVPESKPTRKIEVKTQYSYRDKSTTTLQNTSTTVNGWTRDTSKSCTYGSWGSWTKNVIQSSQTVDVDVRNVYDYTNYTMGHYCTGKVSGAEYRTAPGSVTSNQAFNKNCVYHDGKVKTVKSTQLYTYYHDMDDGVGYYYGSSINTSRCANTCYRWYIMNTTDIYHKEYCSRPIYYPYYKWGNWSEYSDTAYTGSATKEVKTRKLYRYADYDGTINMCDIQLPATNYKYNGTERKPVPTVYDKDKKLLTEGIDYKLIYQENVNAGTAYVTVEGISDQYYGVQTLTFQIGKTEANFSFAENSISKRLNSSDFYNPLSTNADGNILYSSSNPNVAIVDSNTGLVSLKGMGTTIIKASAAEGSNYVSGEASYTLIVTEAAYDRISLDTLSYTFENYGKKIPSNAWISMFGNTVRAKTLSKMYSSAGSKGNCYGFASSSLLLNVIGTDLTIQDFGREHISQMLRTDYNRNVMMTLESLIENLFVSQYSSSVQSCFNHNNNLNGLVSEILSAETEGLNQFPVLGIFGPKGGHALVAYKLETVSATEDRLHVYDCNYPKKDCYITLNKKDGSYKGYSYQIASDEDLWTEKNGRLTYVPFSVIVSLWGNRGNITDLNTNTVKVNSSSFEIYDYQDRKVAEVVNGKLSSKDPDIYQFRKIELSADAHDENQDVVLYLPSDVYTFKNKDEDIFDFIISAVNTDQSVNVETTASLVTVTISDEEKLNHVIIDSERIDSYSISMESAYTASSHSDTLNTKGVVTDSKCASVEMVKIDGANPGYASNELIVVQGSAEEIALGSGEVIDSSAGNDNLDPGIGEKDIARLKLVAEYNIAVYDGTPKEPFIMVKDGTKVLTPGVDYFVKYIHSTKVGKASYKVYGIGKYKGSIVKDYQIIKNVGKATLQKAQNKANGVELTWTEVSKADGYEIYRKEAGVSSKIATVHGLSYTDSSAVAGKTYTYSVKAVIDVNAGPESNLISITRIAQPKKAAVKKTAKGIRIRWKKTAGAKSYIIYRKVKGGSWKKIAKTSKLIYLDKKAKKKKRYYYAVQAVNGKDASSYISSKAVKR